MTAGEDILLAATPEAWVAAAQERWRDLLIDHANCEKKAASTALALMFTYPEDRVLAGTLSRLAREELRHFEQVQKMLETLDVPFVRQRPGRYAASLRSCLRTSDPGRKLDALLTAALIEARSCERFRLLAPRLQAPLAEFYAQLERSEARHFQVYLTLAQNHSTATGLPWEPRLRELAEREGQLATEPDPVFRFHSGPPA